MVKVYIWNLSWDEMPPPPPAPLWPNCVAWHRSAINQSHNCTALASLQTIYSVGCLMKKDLAHVTTEKLWHPMGIWDNLSQIKIAFYFWSSILFSWNAINSVSCTNRSWLHEIPALIMTLSPGLEKNYTLERNSKSFPWMTSMSESLENCQKHIPKSQCSPIQETRS